MKKQFFEGYRTLSTKVWDIPFLLALLLFETILCLAIVNFVSYTEIDWKAYMQEVSGWQDGERDYLKIRGDTGPLVYPAGFLYLYGILKWCSNERHDGEDVWIVQYIFCGLYVVNAAVVLLLYTLTVRSLCKIYGLGRKRSDGDSSASSGSTSLKESNVIWSWRIAMILTCLSKRVHSIFVLRLFNDAPAMLLLYISTYLFAKSKWRTGCVFFSLGVSIKMNVLLFAPGLLLLLLQSSPNLIETIVCLGICASIQLILGAPFLSTYPVSYIRKAFEFDRVFFYKWTVNWKFLPEEIFLAKPLSLLLLLLHLGTLGAFCSKWIQSNRQTLQSKATNNNTSSKVLFLGRPLSPIYIIHTMFVSNFVGIVFARTLHYQFYSWYFHSLPFMLWMTDIPILGRIVLLGMMEYAFLVFPATALSSAVLQLAHLVVLVFLWRGDVPSIVI